MTDSQMWARFAAGDPAYNGAFFVGVRTTGIYCLPSCHARKPHRANVRFFPTAEAARSAGFRSCRKCHPDDFARGADPVLEAVEHLVGEIRAEPARFRDARAVVRRSGFGATRLFELFRQHYHATPADVLLRARLTAARARLLGSEAGVAEIAAESGFDALSTFHEQFKLHHGLTPAAYRGLRGSRRFALSLPAGYPLPYLRRALGRDAQSVSERLDGDLYRCGVRLENGAAQLTLRLAPGRIEAEGTQGEGPELHRIALGLTGLDQDAGGLARLARRAGLARLVAGRPGLTLSQVPAPFDGLAWAIIGQQITLSFACTLRRRLIEKTGTPVGEGLHAPPAPQAVAALEPADLRPLQFSQRKAEYLIAAARKVADGSLDFAALRQMSATRAERTLLAVRGLGPWSVNYLMMRALGFADCVPLGDTGLTSGLQALFALEQRPDSDATRKLMTVFSPHRSLATAHLWQFNRPLP
jgi:AraC family transcriptional regulator of adaptative response / DNA-3-methyladenine glycosylase II